MSLTVTVKNYSVNNSEYLTDLEAPILEAPNVLYRLQSTSDGVCMFPNQDSVILAQLLQATYNATLVDIPAESNVTIELQTSRCMSSRYKREQSLPRCVACTRRWAGDTCRFQSLRSLTRNSNGDIVGFCFQEKPTPAMAMKFPDLWNTSLEKGHIQEIKVYMPSRYGFLLKDE